jgi:ABC-type amino acid transport substrate-binding protein
MKGRVIGGQVGTIHAGYLQNVYAPAGATVKLYTSQQESQFDLARGRLDAILADKVGVYEWLEKTEQGKCCTFAGDEVRDPTYIGEGVGIALRKADEDLKEQFNLAIGVLLANGTYKKINDKYFPFSVY